MLESLGATACPSDHATSAHKVPSQSARRVMDVQFTQAVLLHLHDHLLQQINVIGSEKKILDNAFHTM